MPRERIFVYGTLRRGFATPAGAALARYGEYLADGFIQAALYDIGGYPGAVESPDPRHRVTGELYKVIDREPLLATLDDYEECSARFPEPHEFVRKQLRVSLPGGDSVMAWVYIYNRDVTGRVCIARGDYSAFRANRGAGFG